jgi:hypothetical protein
MEFQAKSGPPVTYTVIGVLTIMKFPAEGDCKQAPFPTAPATRCISVISVPLGFQPQLRLQGMLRAVWPASLLAIRCFCDRVLLTEMHAWATQSRRPGSAAAR